jgi:2-polyprenyl-3-methyl-5-hydroxy-6-metoxy-1,4-benzoquinol methylase
MICRVCDGTNLEPVIDLGMQPWCNNFLTKEQVGKEPFYPLRVLYCKNCATTQLDYTVAKEIMFGDHTYLSGVTKSLSAHFAQIAQEADEKLCAGKTDKWVLDIGSNDGTQLQHFLKLGYKVVGVESSSTTAKMANDAGVFTINDYFNFDLIIKHHYQQKFDLINAAGVFFHLEELHSVTKGIKEALKTDGTFIVQFLYMKNIIANNAFDQIYHEHLLYYTLQTIETLLNRHGLSMYDAYVSPIHGGSVIGYITHAGTKTPTTQLQALRNQEVVDKTNDIETYHTFFKSIQQMKQDNLAYLANAKAAGKTIYGMGAPVKGNTMLNYFGVDNKYIDCLLEKNTLRKGLFAPGNHLPIIMEDEAEKIPDIYYVLAWNFKKEILANNQHLVDKGVEFYFPVDIKE